MDEKKDQKETKTAEKPSLPKGAVQLQPGVYVLRDIRSAFAALSNRPTKTAK
jgi:hypothetical protein